MKHMSFNNNNKKKKMKYAEIFKKKLIHISNLFYECFNNWIMYFDQVRNIHQVIFPYFQYTDYHLLCDTYQNINLTISDFQ